MAFSLFCVSAAPNIDLSDHSSRWVIIEAIKFFTSSHLSVLLWRVSFGEAGLELYNLLTRLQSFKGTFVCLFLKWEALKCSLVGFEKRSMTAGYELLRIYWKFCISSAFDDHHYSSLNNAGHQEKLWLYSRVFNFMFPLSWCIRYSSSVCKSSKLDRRWRRNLWWL